MDLSVNITINDLAYHCLKTFVSISISKMTCVPPPPPHTHTDTVTHTSSFLNVLEYTHVWS